MLSLTHDISTSGAATFNAACSDANQIYAVTNVPDFRVYNWSANQTNTTLALTSPPASIVLGSAASAVVTSNTTRITIVDIVHNTKLDITTNALASYSSLFKQQSAGDITNKIVMSTTSTNSKVCKTDLVAQTVTQLSPTPLSGHQASCILFKPDTSTWLVGTNNGIVFEMNATGGQVGSSLNLPNTPNVSAPTIIVTGLSYYNGLVSCITGFNDLFVYTWPSQVQTFKLPTGGANFGFSAAANSAVLCDSASGLALIFPGGFQGPNSTAGLTELWTNSATAGRPVITAYYNDSVTNATCGGIQPIVTGLDNSKAWAIFGNSDSLGAQLRLFNISNPSICSESTRFQDPPAVDRAVRCIRIRDEGIGKSTIESDQNVAAGTVYLPCTSDRTYIELNIEAGSPNKIDIRVFST